MLYLLKTYIGFLRFLVNLRFLYNNLKNLNIIIVNYICYSMQ